MAIKPSVPNARASRKSCCRESPVGRPRGRKRRGADVIDPLSFLQWPELDRVTPAQFSKFIVCLGLGEMSRAVAVARQVRRGTPQEREARIQGHIRRVEADYASGIAWHEGEDPDDFFASPSPATDPNGGNTPGVSRAQAHYLLSPGATHSSPGDH